MILGEFYTASRDRPGSPARGHGDYVAYAWHSVEGERGARTRGCAGACVCAPSRWQVGARRGAALSMECESCGASEFIEQGDDSVCAICGTLAQQRVAEVVTWEEVGSVARRKKRTGRAS